MKLFKAKIMYHFSGNQAQIDKFLRLKAARAKKTRDFYRLGLAQYAKFADEAWPPTPELITDFIRHCQDRGLEPGTVHAYYRAVRGWCNWLHKNDIIDHNPIDLIDPPKQPKRKDPRAANPKELKALIQYLESEVEQAVKDDALKERWVDIRDLCIISLTLDTGMRVGEVERLKIKDINLDRSTIFIPTAKDGEPRTVAFGPVAKGDLSLWLKIRAMLPTEHLSNLFISHTWGKWIAFTHWGMRKMLKKRCMKIDIETIGLHQLRHSFASQSLKNGADIEYVREQLGHASITTTAIYTRRTPDDLSDIQKRTSPRSNL